VSDVSFETIPYEDGGVFLRVPFEGEPDSTLLFVAERDFAGLLELARDPDADWTDLRDEVFSLLEHSGHDQSHRLGPERTRALRRHLRGLDRENPSSPATS